MIRIAGVQGFYGDSPMGAIAIAKEGAADYLVHDALAELTLSILQKDRQDDPSFGYARDIEFNAATLYPLAIQKGIKIVTNSGGLNPVAAAKKVAEILAKKGILGVKLAAITGDDLLTNIKEMMEGGETLAHLESGEAFSQNSSLASITHANAYVGARAVADALDQGAQIIFAGRVADPCLTLGILVHHYKWKLNGDNSYSPSPTERGLGDALSLPKGGEVHESPDLTPYPSPMERGKESVRIENKVFLSHYDKWKTLKDFARENRKNPTPEEDILWQNIRNRKLKFKFRRQHAIEDFIVDFVCLEKKLIIEVDRVIHEKQMEYDSYRDLCLNSLGFEVIRFTNEDITSSINNVLSRIKFVLSEPEEIRIGRINKCLKNIAPTSPSPTERGLGGEVLSQSDLDKLAAGITIGHILECGGQASGGNSYAEWPMDYNISTLGYPIAHIEEDGSAVLTKLTSAGGKVSRDTIREQLVYEIHDPSHYITPDVIVDLTKIKLEETGHNHVSLSGVKGKPRPDKLKLAMGRMEGYLSEQFFFFSYPFAYQKAKKFVEAVKEIWSRLPVKIDKADYSFVGINGIHGDAAPLPPDDFLENINETGVRLVIKHADPKVGKIAFQAIVALGLNGPPGLISMPGWGKQNRMLLSLWPSLVDRKWVKMKIEIVNS